MASQQAGRNGCCRRRTKSEMDELDRRGYVDRVAVERAAQGKPGTLNRREAEELVVHMAIRNRAGLNVIQQHTGYSRSQIAAILQRRRGTSC